MRFVAHTLWQSLYFGNFNVFGLCEFLKFVARFVNISFQYSEI